MKGKRESHSGGDAEKVIPQNRVSAASFTENARENDELIENKLTTIMYVKGDVKHPRSDSVKTMKSILRTEMNIVLSEATHIACLGNSEVISHEHILFLMRKNKLKLKRLLEHLAVLDIPHLCMMSFYNTEDDTLPPKKGKRVKKCLEFLKKLGGFREFISNLDDKSLDPTMKMRFERRNLLVKYMSLSEYVEFTAESSRATFCPRQQIWTFKQWLLQDKLTFLNMTSLAVIMIEFLALETIAVIIDTAIHIQAKKLGTGHIFSHLPPIPDFDFAVPISPKKFLKRLAKRRKEAPDLPSTSGEETSEASYALKRRAATQTYSTSSDNSKKLRLNTSVENSNFETIHKEQSDSNSNSKSSYLIIDEASNLSSNNSISSTSNHDLNNIVRKADISDSLLDAQKEELMELDSSLILELKTDAKLSSPTDNDVKECNLENDSNSSQNPEQEVSNSDDSIAYHELDTSSKRTDEVLENNKSALSTQNDLKGKISLEIGGKIYIVSESDMKSAYLQKYLSNSWNSSSSLINMKGTTDSPSTFRLVTDVKINSKPVPITNKAIKKCKTSQKKDTKTSIKCDSVDKACFSNSVVSQVKNNSERVASTDKSVKKYTESRKRDAITCPVSSEDELPGPEENINNPHSSISSSVTSEGTSSRIHATTKPSVVSEIKNSSKSAPSTDKNVTYTGSFKNDAVLCPISDSDTESHDPQENVNSLQNFISVNEVLKPVPGVSDTVHPPPQKNLNSLRNSTSFSKAPKSVSSIANNDGESDTSSKDTFNKEFVYFTGRPSPYVLQQREIFKRIALTPEEITEAYLELQEPLPIHSWFTEELFFRKSPLICLTDSPDVARVTNYMNLV